jgi:hypothetical protein
MDVSLPIIVCSVVMLFVILSEGKNIRVRLDRVYELLQTWMLRSPKLKNIPPTSNAMNRTSTVANDS